ncbi:MAG TPA: hypothetical protein VMJ10_16885 [Kofleriaceae bacterium]|nr:hypothetical protein [Kofleriaceae bacterium]
MPTLRDRIVVVAFLAVMILPFAAKHAHVRDHAIDGVIAKAPHPTLTFDGVRDESFQAAYKAWFENRLGLEGYAIYIDNTLLYHLFDDTKTGSSVRIGSDHVLFMDEDIWYYNRDTAPFDPTRLDAFAARIADLQARLRAEHRAFVPVIIPSKTTIYRDMVPARWTRDLGTPPPSDAMFYRTMKRALDSHHVTYVDARELLVTSSQPRAMLWGPTARHWSAYGACLALQQIASRFTELTGRRLEYDCHASLGEGSSYDDDYDLLRLLNAWGVAHDRFVPRVTHEPPTMTDAVSVMFVGTSFCWALLRDAELSRRFRSARLDYYNTTLFTGPDHAPTPVQPRTPEWRDAFVGEDLYVLDLFESYYAVPESFLDHFLDELGSELH